MDIADAPHLEWIVLTEDTQLATNNGQLVAVAYSVPAYDQDGRGWVEFGWLPVDQPDLVDVHFGVDPGAGDMWDSRWERARRCTEWEIARRSVRE